MIPKELGDHVVARLRDSELSVHVVAQFTGVVDSTVEAWKSGRAPRGGKLNALWHLLHFAGVDSPELRELPEFNRILGELLAFGVISLEEAQIICGSIAEQAVWDTIRGGRKPANQEYTAEQLQAEYGEKLDKEKDKWRERIPADTQQPRPDRLVVQSQPPMPVPSERPADNRFLLDLAIRLGALRPMLAYAVSDALSAEDRAELRRLIGEEGMSALSIAMQSLISERIRTARQVR